MSTIAKDQTQINDRIRAKELRLIGHDGEQLGVKTKFEAIEIAERVNLDVVLVAPNAEGVNCLQCGCLQRQEHGFVTVLATAWAR